MADPHRTTAHSTLDYRHGGQPSAPPLTRFYVVGSLGLVVALLLSVGQLLSAIALWPLLYPPSADLGPITDRDRAAWSMPREVQPSLSPSAIWVGISLSVFGVIPALLLWVGSVRMIQRRRGALLPCRWFVLLQIMLAVAGLFWGINYGTQLIAMWGGATISESVNIVVNVVGFCLMMVWPIVVSWTIVGDEAKVILAR